MQWALADGDAPHSTRTTGRRPETRARSTALLISTASQEALTASDGGKSNDTPELSDGAEALEVVSLLEQDLSEVERE